LKSLRLAKGSVYLLGEKIDAYSTHR